MAGIELPKCWAGVAEPLRALMAERCGALGSEQDQCQAGVMRSPGVR